MEAWTRIVDFEQEYQKRKYRQHRLESKKHPEKFSLSVLSTSNPNSSMIMGGDASAWIDPVEIESMEEILKISIYFLAEEVIPSFESQKNRRYFANLNEFCHQNIKSSYLTQLTMTKMCLQEPLLQQRKDDLQNRSKTTGYVKPKEIEENMQQNDEYDKRGGMSMRNEKQ